MFFRSIVVFILTASLVAFAGCAEDSDGVDDGGAGGMGGIGGAGGMSGIGGAGGMSGIGGMGGMGGTGGAGGVGAAGGMGGTGGSASGPVTVPASGTYSLGLNLVELGGFVLHLQLEVESEDRGEAGGSFTRLALSAIQGDRVSDPFVEATDVTIMDGDTFIAVFPEAALPADFSPTGSEVRFRLDLEGAIQSNGSFCGLVTGEVLTLDLPLEASTFAVEPWAERSDPVKTSCESGGAGSSCERLEPEQCPDLAPGMNMNFASCGEARGFRLFLPEGHDPSQRYPLIFLWHGLTSNVDAILENSALADRVTEGNFILVVPVSRQQAVEWDQLTVADSKDLAFFDDMVTCAQSALGADPGRIYTTGLSGGGLFSTYLGVMRGDVIAAAAPMSGGLIIDYPEPTRTVPYLVTWGGEEDIAVEQNFHIFAQDLLSDLSDGGHFVATCDHGRGHEWPQDLNEGLLQFFADHPLEVQGAPYLNALPEAFPDYCSPPSAE